MKLFLAGLALGVVALCAGYAIASRNSSGTMSGINGPYVSGTTISSSVVNARLADIETEITDSLDRSGKGGMLADLRGIDGTLAAPAYSWTSETGSGLFRNGVNDIRMSIGGGLRQQWTSTGSVVTGTFTANDAITENSTATTTTNLAAFLAASMGNGQQARFVIGKAGGANNLATVSFTPNVTAANSTACLGVGGNETTLCTDGNAVTTAGTTKLGTTTIGATGTAISASFRGTVSWTPGVLAAHGCTTNTITLTGATAGTECHVGSPGQPLEMTLLCTITANTCNLTLCNEETGNATGAAGTYSCRAWNP